MGAEALARPDELAAACPAYALRVVRALESAGWEAWVVGGWVRDALRGVRGHDVDVTTSAPWREAERVLRAAGIEVHETGTRHGTVTAVVDGRPVETTTYRVEGSYTDHRHPDEVRFVTDVREDLARRDFTMNAMAWHPDRGLLDPFGGADDLLARTVRAVGDPARRFDEDALRVLRAVRFAARMGFSIEPATQRALVASAGGLAGIAQERIGQELDGIVRSGRAGWALLEEPEVMCAAVPELQDSWGFDQNSPFHVYDVLEHTAHVCRACEAFTAGLASPQLRWAALLHDVAKPATYSEDVTGRGHFFGHPKAGARMSAQILRRLAIPGEVAVPATLLVRYHDHVVLPTRRSMLRTLQKFTHSCPGREVPLTYDLLDLKRADAVSKSPRVAGYAHELDEMGVVLRRALASGAAFKVSQLKVDGADVMRLRGIPAGPGVGMVLESLVTCVVDGDVPNEREAQLRWLEL